MLADILEAGRRLADDALQRLLPPETAHPASIHKAMRHSIFAGGKRLRPILCMESARVVAGSLPDGVDNLGAAIEMLHTYSLVHDDLPALDNDDLRRGRPTCHVVFGEAMAILAGDALQTQAYEVLAKLRCPAEACTRIIAEIAHVAHLRMDGLPPGVDPLLDATATYEPAIGTGVFSYATHGAVVVLGIHAARPAEARVSACRRQGRPAWYRKDRSPAATSP